MARSMSSLFAHEILTELCGFSESYFGRVVAREAYSSEQEGGGYALESQVRPGHYIPTGTAPYYIANLAAEFERRADSVGEYDCSRLSAAIRTIEAAARSLDYPNDRARGTDYTRTQVKHLRESVSLHVPEMAAVLQRLEARAAAPA